MKTEQDRQMQERLRAWEAPPPREGVAEKAWMRAEAAFHAGADEAADGKRRSEPVHGWLRWAGALTAFALVTSVAFWSGRKTGQREERSMAVASSFPSDARLIAELERLFPGQLQGVIRGSDGSTEIVTSSEGAAFSHQPLVVELRAGAERVRIVSFSGERITTRLAGRPLALEFLLTPEGGLIVSSDAWVWQSGQGSTAPGGWQIEGHALGAKL